MESKLKAILFFVIFLISSIIVTGLISVDLNPSSGGSTDISGLVPYVGGNANLNLTGYNITATNFSGSLLCSNVVGANYNVCTGDGSGGISIADAAAALGNWSGNQSFYDGQLLGINTNVTAINSTTTTNTNNIATQTQRITDVNSSVFSIGNWTSDKSSYARLDGANFTGNINLSTNDAVLTMFSNNSLLGGTPSSGGLNIIQTIPEAKGGIYWTGYDDFLNYNLPVAWMVSHYNSSSGNGVHSHWSVETLDNSTGTTSINTHLYVEYGADVKYPNVGVSSSNFLVSNLAVLNRTGLSKFTPFTTMDIYPNNQSSLALRTTTNTNNISLVGVGSNFINFEDNITMMGTKDIVNVRNIETQKISVNNYCYLNGTCYNLSTLGGSGITIAQAQDALGNWSGNQSYYDGQLLGINTNMTDINSTTVQNTAQITSLHSIKLNISDQRYNDSATITAQLSTQAFATINATTADVSSSVITAYTNVMSLPLSNGKTTEIECTLLVDAAATTTGIQINTTITGTSSQRNIIEYYSSATAQAICQGTAALLTCAATASAGTTVTPTRIYMASTQSSAGTFTIGLKSEINASAVTVRKGSWCRVMEQ
jgi:hypothetical protein